MLRSWTPSDSCQSWSLYQKIQGMGITTTDQLLDMINAQLPRELFPSDFGENAVSKICKAYWDRIRERFNLGSECEGWFVPIKVMTVEEFKAETLGRIKAGLWKLKLGALSHDDESVIHARLTALKEVVRLAPKFHVVGVHWDYWGLNIRDICLASVVPFDTKGEVFERILLGEDQIWFVKRSGNSDHRWYIYFGDGGIPEVLDYRIEVKVDASGNTYIFPLDDLGELLRQQDLEKIKALVGK